MNREPLLMAFSCGRLTSFNLVIVDIKIASRLDMLQVNTKWIKVENNTITGT